ncbi:MAG: diguanylate cyclase [Defluviitaleaceae bacterium]|nr:diguanylate cyclase [Defluviitaleaceae bacterium]MCL2273377.1 diguanylate cyclase [Defluviitaleaceae bacterium]
MSKKKHSILIVDDERLNISILRSILSADYTVYAAGDGQDAIETANNFLPDVILLDIIMPGMDGYDVIKALKKSEKTKNIPVIFITGLDKAEAEEKGLTLGAADYIAKPFVSAIVKLRVHNQIKLIVQFRQQVLMTKISHDFLSDAYIDAVFTKTLRGVGMFMDVAQILLYKYDSDEDALICQSEWLKPELEKKSKIGTTLRLEGPIFSIVKNLLDGDRSNLRSETADPEDDKRHITKPIFVKGKLHALLDISKEDGVKEWSENERNLSVLIADIFAGVFERDAMERQFSIVEKTPDLIMSISETGVVEYTNPALETVTGYTKSELITNGLGILFQDERMEKLTEKYIPKAMQGESVQFEMDFVCKDGIKRILFVSIFQRDIKSLGMILRDMTRVRELEEENEKIFFDGLTGIYNRRYFDESVPRLIASLSRTNSPLTIMMIDIDFFKKFNDTYGHISGDKCLKMVAEVLNKAVPRADDFVARYGGEEFVVVLPNTNENGACIVADRIMSRIRESNIPHVSSDVAKYVTFSIGFTTAIALHTLTLENYVQKADEMLYQSKQSGRNKYSFQSLNMEAQDGQKK